MSESTFGLTGVDIEAEKNERNQQVQEEDSGSTKNQPIEKKQPVAILPKSTDNTNGQSNKIELPQVEQKKSNNSNQSIANAADVKQPPAPPNKQAQPTSKDNNTKSVKKLPNSLPDQQKSGSLPLIHPSTTQQKQIDIFKSIMQQNSKDQNTLKRQPQQNSSVQQPYKTTYSSNFVEKEKVKDVFEKYQSQAERVPEQVFQERYTYITNKASNFEQAKQAYDLVVLNLNQIQASEPLRQEIQKNHDILNQQQHLFNQIDYEIKQNEKLLVTLKEQLGQISQPMTTEEEQVNLDQLYTVFEDLVFKYDNEVFKQESLENMYYTRKEIIDVLHENIYNLRLQQEYLKDRGHKSKNDQIEFDNQLDSLRKLYDVGNKNTGFQSLKLNDRFENLIEGELAGVDDQLKLKEIFKHENEIKMEKLRKEEMQRQNELTKKRQIVQEQENRQYSEQLEEKQQFDVKDLQFQRLMKVTKDENYAEFFDEIQKGNTRLQQMQQDEERQIQALQKAIHESQQRLQKLSYESKERAKEQEKIDQQHQQQQLQQELHIPLSGLNIPIAKSTSNDSHDSKATNSDLKSQDTKGKDQDQTNVETVENLSEFDNLLIQKVKERQEKEFAVKKLQRILDEVTLSASRMLYQLDGPGSKPENKQILQKDLAYHITMIGLTLDKMLGILTNKQDSIRVESINTDATIDQTPNFMGINSTSYINRNPQFIRDSRLPNLDETSGDNTARESHFDNQKDDGEEKEECLYNDQFRNAIKKEGEQITQGELKQYYKPPTYTEN